MFLWKWKVDNCASEWFKLIKWQLDKFKPLVWRVHTFFTSCNLFNCLCDKIFLFVTCCSSMENICLSNLHAPWHACYLFAFSFVSFRTYLCKVINRFIAFNTQYWSLGSIHFILQFTSKRNWYWYVCSSFLWIVYILLLFMCLCV